MKTVAFSFFRLTILSSAIVTFAAVSADAALVLYYNFDDGAASVTDSSGGAHFGTISGPTYTNPGGGYNNTPGRAMRFAGGADRIQVDDGATAFDSLMTTGAVSI